MRTEEDEAIRLLWDWARVNCPAEVEVADPEWAAAFNAQKKLTQDFFANYKIERPKYEDE